jgi:hypothetical protein
MKKLLFFSFLFISFYSQAQWNPTGAKTRFVPGIGLGTSDTTLYSNVGSHFIDSNIVVMHLDSALYYKGKGWFRAIGSGGGGGATLTLGNGLLGTSYNGSAAVTAKVDTATISTKANVTALLTGYAAGASVVKYTDTAAMLSSRPNLTYVTANLATKLDKSDSVLANRITADRVFVNASLALKLNISDTATMLSTHPNTTLVNSQLALKLDKSDSTIANRVTAERTFVNAALALKVNYTDTASMLSTHPNTTLVNSLNALNVKYTDTASMLSTHPNTTLLNSSLALKQNTLTLTTTGTTGASTLVGSTLNIPNYATGGGGISLSSLSALNPILYNNTTGVFSADTNRTVSAIATGGSLLKVRDSVYGVLNASKFNITDTALVGGTNYYNKVTVDGKLGLEVNYTDTSSMLGNYTRTANYGITKTGQAFGVDTSALSTKANVVALLTGYTAGALVVKYTDTAAMLSSRPNLTYVTANLATKQNTLTLTTTGTSGAATLVGATLNIPQYAGGGGTTTNALTLGNGLNTGSFNGSAAVTATVDTLLITTKNWHKKGIDSVANVASIANALKFNITDTALVGGTNYYNKTYIDANLALKGTVSSVATNTGSGITGGTITTTGTIAADTTTVLATKARLTASLIGYAANALVMKYTDTASALGNYTRTANYGITKTGQAFGVDTAAMSTKANVVALLTGYTAGALVVKYTDTASMLSSRPNLTYVTANLATKLNVTDSVLANRITADRVFVNAALPLKVNVSDTATMLSGYKTFYPRVAISLTTTGTSGAATYNNGTGVLNIPSYAGGGGTTTNALTLGSGLTGTSFNGSAAVTATVDTAAFKIATKTDIKDDYTSIVQSTDSTYFTIVSKSGLQVDTVRLRYTTLTGGGGGGSAADMSVAQVTRSTTYANTASYVDLTFDVNNLVNATGDINHSTSTNTNRFVIGTTGVYSVTINGTIAPTVGGTNNTDIELQLFKNGASAITNSYVYAENSSADLEQFSRTMYVSLTAGDYFTVQSKYLLAASTLQNAQVAVAKMSGTTGATGATGPAGSVAFTNTQGISAAGSTQGTATLLTTKLNDISTVATGTGVRLPPATVSDYISVINHGANPLLIYPATGETVEGLAANVPLTLLEGQSYDAGVATAGAWVGINVNVYDDENNSLNIGLHTSQPAVPISGNRIFSKNIGGRAMVSATGPSGVDYPFQPHTGKSKVAQWQPIGNATTTPIADGILAPTNLTTVTARNVATTNILTRMKRLGFVSAATAGAVTGSYFLAGAQQYTIGDGAGLGGFHYIERFGISDAAAVSGARAFIGWRSVVTAPTNVDPAAGTNQFGLAQISGDNTQWYIVYGGSAAQTAIALGTSLGAPTLTNTAFEISFFAPPNSNNTVKYTVTNLGTNVIVSGTLTGTAGTALPSSTTLLAPCTWRTNNATALAVGIDISSIYIETDQ